MGLLDEAIKEHLELKRRHGADPGEVARLEHEALGPARRDPAPAAIVDEPVAAEPVAEPVAQDDPYLEDDTAPPYDEVPADERLEGPIRHVAPEEPEPEVVEPEPEPTAAVEPEPEPTAAEPAVEVEQPTQQFSLEEVEAASQAAAEPAPAEAPGEPESRPPAEDVVPADDEPDAEDVLEETPEFLQETPEHDRLWFEQKPPRDFDF
jgi:hypothetical protein